MMRQNPDHVRLVGMVARAASFVALAALLTGCMTIPERAWRNGMALSQSTANQRAMSGQMSFQNSRQLNNVLNFGSLGHYQEAPEFSPFPRFGVWY